MSTRSASDKGNQNLFNLINQNSGYIARGKGVRESTRPKRLADISELVLGLKIKLKDILPKIDH